MFCRWSTITARLAAVAKITVAQGSSSSRQKIGSATAVTSDASDA